MRKSLVFLAAAMAAGAWLASPGQAAPVHAPVLAKPAADLGLVQKAQLFPRRYYRRNPYAVPPVAPVVPAVPVAPPVVVQEPVVVVPMRPASCGEFRFWNGVACVDARYNKPYLGPKP